MYVLSVCDNLCKADNPVAFTCVSVFVFIEWVIGMVPQHHVQNF